MAKAVSMDDFVKQIAPPPPRCSAGPAPKRVPDSVRRTSSLDFFWPDGQAGDKQMIGRARDIVTPFSGGPPTVCREDAITGIVKLDRTIVAIEADPPKPALARLVGERGGGGLRKVLAQVVPEERENATPLYLLLDDLAGASLVSSWAWAHWNPNWLNDARSIANIGIEEAMRSREGVCIGFIPGSSAFEPDRDRSGAPAGDVRNADDPEGWHVFPEVTGINMRRARRIDVWMDDVMVIDSAFQDSASTPSGERRAVHEYRLSLTADPQSLAVLSIEAEPRVLPHNECPAAVGNMPRMIGTPLPDLREKVLVELRGMAGCTHLNDALRALADVPALLDYLPARALKRA
jgi:hypothetical protein